MTEEEKRNIIHVVSLNEEDTPSDPDYDIIVCLRTGCSINLGDLKEGLFAIGKEIVDINQGAFKEEITEKDLDVNFGEELMKQPHFESCFQVNNILVGESREGLCVKYQSLKMKFGREWTGPQGSLDEIFKRAMAFVSEKRVDKNEHKLSMAIEYNRLGRIK